MEYSLAAAFLIGLFSSVHCLGMCGSIAGALALSLKPEVREDRTRLTQYVLAYNFGRITSYTLAGALVGTLGATLGGTFGSQTAHDLIRILAGVVMIAIGLYLAGWVPQLRRMDTLGAPLWRRLEPIGRRLIPVSSLPYAFLYGAVWGWLPCGLVYYALIWTVAAGGPAEGATYMLAFGLGTVPAVASAGLVTGWLARMSRMPQLRQLVGTLVIAMGLASILFGKSLEIEQPPDVPVGGESQSHEQLR